MIFTETKLKGSYLVDIERRADQRGFFARVWCADEFEALNLNTRLLQSNIAFNYRKGTLRGMHFQLEPHAEAKLVRCTRGAIYDVMIDLRPESPSYRQWVGAELTADNSQMLYIPEGFAHGYQTLADNTEICYNTTQTYAPDSARGVRYDDPAFGIDWPLPVVVISDADKNWPDYRF